MKKIKSPWYGITWIFIWTIALTWFLIADIFNSTEKVGLVIVWAVLVGVTVGILMRYYFYTRQFPTPRPATPKQAPALNAPCPCGSGKKYKRCCGA